MGILPVRLAEMFSAVVDSARELCKQRVANPLGPQTRRPEVYVPSSANTSRRTPPVRSISASVCAVEMKPVSNCDGAK